MIVKTQFFVTFSHAPVEDSPGGVVGTGASDDCEGLAHGEDQWFSRRCTKAALAREGVGFNSRCRRATTVILVPQRQHEPRGTRDHLEKNRCKVSKSKSRDKNKGRKFVGVESFLCKVELGHVVNVSDVQVETVMNHAVLLGFSPNRPVMCAQTHVHALTS